MRHIDFKMMPCTARRLPDILALQEAAFEVLENPEMLRRNTAEMLGKCLQKPHCTLGAFDGDKLAAIAILYDAENVPEEDLSHLLQTVNVEERKSANFKLCIVHPDYRGRKLQQLLGLKLEEAAKKKGIDILCSTVSPLNGASSHSLMKIGYRLDSVTEKYGFVRELYVKEI